MRPLKILTLLLLYFCSACGGSTAPSANVPSPPPSTAANRLTFTSQPGDYVGAGQSLTYDSSIAASLTCDGNSLVATVTAPDGLLTWTLALAAAPGTKLQVGTFTNAGSWPFHTQDQPGISMFGQGRSCGRSGGRFTVTEAQFGSDGRVLRFRATFEQRCVNFIDPALLPQVPLLTGDIALTSPPLSQYWITTCRAAAAR